MGFWIIRQTTQLHGPGAPASSIVSYEGGRRVGAEDDELLVIVSLHIFYVI